MKTAVCLVAAGLFASTAAFAHDNECSESHHKAHHASRDVQQGRDVRTGMDVPVDHSDQSANAENSDVSNRLEAAPQSVARTSQRAGNQLAVAADEAIHPSRVHLDKGELRSGNDVRDSLTTNPLGLFDGEGINLQWEKPFADKFSWLVGGRYARAVAGGGSVTAFGAQGGIDWFMIGRRNEGLFLGPRVNLGAGTGTVGPTTLLGNIGAAGELGYDWIASNGITAGLASGVNVNLGGGLDTQNVGASRGLASATPYGRLNIGYSW